MSLLKRFLKYTEIQTKITSVLPFAMTLGILLYQKYDISLLPTSIFFVSMLIFDLTTTAINNYIDSKTNGEALPFSQGVAKRLIFGMFFLAAGLGLYLAYLTDVIILLVGMLCFFCGVVYTYGPVAINRIPLGEALSGIFYGLFIPLILIYINMPKGQILSFELVDWQLSLNIQLIEVIRIGLIAVVPAVTTANIMLANNICDVDKDITHGRFTLAYYLGKQRGLVLWEMLYAVSYVGVGLLVIFGIAPWTIFISLMVLPSVLNNIQRFKKEQVKSQTFITSVQCFILINGSVIVGIFIYLLGDWIV